MSKFRSLMVKTEHAIEYAMPIFAVICAALVFAMLTGLVVGIWKFALS